VRVQWRITALYEITYIHGVIHTAAEVVALRLENTLGESNEIIIEQGKKFNVHFTCVDAKGEAVVSGGWVYA